MIFFSKHWHHSLQFPNWLSCSVQSCRVAKKFLRAEFYRRLFAERHKPSPDTSRDVTQVLFVSYSMDWLPSGAGVRLSTTEVWDRLVGRNPTLLFTILYVISTPPSTYTNKVIQATLEWTSFRFFTFKNSELKINDSLKYRLVSLLLDLELMITYSPKY